MRGSQIPSGTVLLTYRPFRRSFGGRAGLLVVTMAVLCLFPAESAAQDTEPRFSFAWRGTDLERTLETFLAEARIDLAWEPRVVVGKRVFCVARDLPAEEVLQCILEGTGLDFYRRSSGLYVLVDAAEAPPLLGSLRGIIVDAQTRQPVSHAHVLLAEATRGRVANEGGLFTFDRILPGDYHLRVSHIGYRTSTSAIFVEPGRRVEAEIALRSQPILVSPVVIDGIGMQPSSSLLGYAVMGQDELTAQAGLAASDVTRRLDALLGVRVSDATADVHIQGGEAGEHQFRLDGAPVFIPLNVATFIGPFSPFALGSIRINKAGFGVPLGSQIAGVIEAEHDLRYSGPVSVADPDHYYQRTVVQADPLSVNARHSAFVTRQSGVQMAFMGAGRIGMWSVYSPSPLVQLLDGWNRVDTFLLSAFADRNTPFANLPPVGSPSLGFADFHAAARIRFNPLSSIHTSAFYGQSRLGNDLSEIDPDTPDGSQNRLADFEDIYGWKTGVFQARFETVLTSRTLARFGVRGSLYKLSHEFVAPDAFTESALEDDGNRIFETAVEARLDHAVSDRHYAEFGLEAILTGDRFSVAGTQQIPVRHEFQGGRLAGYVNNKIQLGQRGVVETGVRFTYLGARQSLYAEPRLSLRMDWPGTKTGTWSFFIGTGLYRQYVNQFDISSRSPRTFVSSTRFWMAADSTVTPPKSAHLAGELYWRPSPRWTLQGEAHYKRHYHILALDYAAATLTDVNQPQNEFLRASSGRTYGYAALLSRSLGLGNVKARYEYTASRRRIMGLFQNKELDVPWLEPHRFELAADIMPLQGLVLLARWRLISGRSWGFRQAYYDFLSAHLNDLETALEDLSRSGVSSDALERIERQVNYYQLTEPDGHALPRLTQIDAGISYSTGIGPVRIQTRLDVVNLLNRSNIAEWQFLLDEDSYFGLSGDPELSGILERGMRALLPRITTLALKITW